MYTSLHIESYLDYMGDLCKSNKTSAHLSKPKLTELISSSEEHYTFFFVDDISFEVSDLQIS